MTPTRHDFHLPTGLGRLGGFFLLAMTFYSAWLSFQWIKITDIAFMYYHAWLVNEQGFFPYRDIMDTSFPGSFLAYALLTRITGYSDLAFHITDIVILVILLLITWRMIKPLGQVPAVIAVLSYGIYYVGSSPSMHLQRDYLAILPISAAIVLMHNTVLSLPVRAFCIGLLFGMAISIKPQLGIGLPIVLFGLSRRGVLPVAGGLLTCGSAFTAWLYTHQALADFIYMAQHYLPFYLTGEETTGHVWQQAYEFLRHNFLPLMTRCLLSLGAAIGGFYWYRAATGAVNEKSYATLLFLMVPAYMTATLSGLRVWDYHVMPMDYFLIVVGALAFTPFPAASRPQQYTGRVIKAVFILNMISVGVLPNINFITDFDKNVMREENAATELATYLQTHYPPGEKTQLIVASTNIPLFHVLLDKQQVMATRYPLCWFCGAVSGGATEGELKTAFLRDLQTALPSTLIIDRHVFGERNVYPELQSWMSATYRKDYQYRQFDVYTLGK